MLVQNILGKCKKQLSVCKQGVWGQALFLLQISIFNINDAEALLE